METAKGNETFSPPKRKYRAGEGRWETRKVDEEKISSEWEKLPREHTRTSLRKWKTILSFFLLFYARAKSVERQTFYFYLPLCGRKSLESFSSFHFLFSLINNLIIIWSGGVFSRGKGKRRHPALSLSCSRFIKHLRRSGRRSSDAHEE